MIKLNKKGTHFPEYLTQKKRDVTPGFLRFFVIEGRIGMKRIVSLVLTVCVLCSALMLSSCNIIDSGSGFIEGLINNSNGGGAEITPPESGNNNASATWPEFDGDEIVDPTLPGMKSFNTANELTKFMSDNKEKIGGSFIYLDLSDAKENGIHIPFTSPPAYTFEYKEGEGGCYTNARLTTWFELYVEELGTDTDVEYDVPYHSISLYLVSNECADEIKDLSFEFYKYSNSHEKWNYVVKINNQNGVCIADMYYYTGLEIDREWIVSFITQNMKIFK